MTTITFENLKESTDKKFVEHIKAGYVPKIESLLCPNHKNPSVHISIQSSPGGFDVKVLNACCIDFQNLVKDITYPLSV
jgi:hypothetical protein